MKEKDEEEELLRSTALQNSQSILHARRQAEEVLRKQSEWFRVTLSSIGDAVISTDVEGRVSLMNGVAETLTGWTQSDALGQLLTDIFNVVDETTREPVDNPSMRALQEGTIVGLANHTVLVAKDGSERLIDDSAAPIRDDKGNIVGSVLVFRDVTERASAENALQLRERELRDFFENAPVGLNWAAPDGTILRANQAELDMLGYPHDEYVGRNIADFHVDNAAVGGIFRDLSSGETVRNRPVQLRSKDGSIRDVLINANVLFDDSRFVHARFFNRDITELKRAEELLRESEIRKASMFESAIDCIISIDYEGSIIEFNRAAETTFGYRREDVIGRELASVIIPESYREAHRQGLAKYLATGEEAILNQRIELSALRADGSDFPVELTVTRIPSEGPPIFTAFLRDISERRLDEATAVRLASIVESSQDAIVSKNLDGIIATWNKGAEKMFGYTAEEAVGRSITLIIPKDRLSEEETVLSRLRRGEKIEHFETVRVTKDGRLLDISLSVSPLMDNTGRVVGASKVARDITERKLAEEALRKLAADLSQADRRKNEFLAMLAHELRNPLAPIRNALQIMRVTVPDDASETYDMLERQVGQLVRLVDDLLDISRISSGKIELRLGEIELASSVNHAVEAARPSCEARGVELRVTLPSEPIYMSGDPARLTQVIGNLLNNSCKFTDPGGHIDLLVKRDGEEAELVVRDNGIGIDPDEIPFIFDMFVQADTSLKHSGSGLGIGLTLVRNLVEMHAGTVEAHSSGLGQGTEFVIRLPALPGSTKLAPAKTTADVHPPVKPLRILVVDDNVDSASSLDMLLRLTGHEVRMVHDGLDAVETAAEFLPEVILLDIGLPRLNGYEAARRIRQQPWGKEIILIALTGWGQEEDRQRSKEAGFDRHMVKPIEHSELMKLLNEVTIHGRDAS